MSDAPFIPFYTSDFLGGTSGMTAATKGVYITLLCLMYEAEAPLKQSWETLARRCGSTLPAFRRAIQALQDDDKITVSGAGIWSEKCEKHIALRRERQSSAKAAAEKRWEKTKEKQAEGDAAALRTQCKPEPDPESEDKKESPPTPQGGAVVVSAPERPPSKEDRELIAAEFERVWKHYPRKVGIGQARHAWTKARNRASYETITAGLRPFIRSVASTPVDKIPHFATWLNGDRWMDEPSHAVNRPRTSTEDVERLSNLTSTEDVARLFDGLGIPPPAKRIEA